MSGKTSAIKIQISIVVLLATTLLFSCENDIKAVVKLTKKDSIPDVSVRDIHVRQTEYGRLTMELTAPKMVSYQSRDAYTEFPNGMKIVFYDSLMNPTSDLTANYGISWDSRRTMQARGNVIVRNFQRQQQLNTEILNWNQNTRKVNSTEFVKITDPEKIIFGKGMESDEIFDNWIIRNVTGTMYINENKPQ